MPNIYLKSKKLKPSQIENLKRNVSFIIAEMGIQIKSFSKDAPLKTKLNITVNGPFSYRTADKFLHYHSGMEISLKSCTALIQFYNTYFEPEIHGDIVAFVSHDLAKENARLKTQFHPKETDAFSRKCIDFFTGTYYIYYQSSVFAEKITGGIVQIYEWNNRLRMKLISRLMSDEELDLAKEVIEETQCTPDEGMEHFLQHERIRETGEVFFYHDEWIDINEKKETFTVSFTDSRTSNQVMLLSLHNTMSSLYSDLYKKYIAGMGFSIYLSGDRTKIYTRRVCLSKYKFSMTDDCDLLNRHLSLQEEKDGISVISTEEVTNWLREVRRKRNG